MVNQNKSFQITVVHLQASKEVREFSTLYGIRWSYIAEVLWTGRFFERMVHSVKRCLKKILGQARVRSDELLTILEIENVCNCRPLTYIYDDDII